MEEEPLENRKVRLGRLMLKSTSIGAAAALIGWGASGPRLAAGVLAGSLAAAFYVWGYVASHLSRAGREAFYDSAVARSAVVRMLGIGAAGAVAYVAGRSTFVGFLAGFAAAFALLLVSEIGHIKKELKARGVLGGASR